MSTLPVVTDSASDLPASIDRLEVAIAAATTPAEVKMMLASVDAAIAYASRYYREQGDVIRRAKALRVIAERRLGEILAAMPKATGGQPYQATGAKAEPVETPTLADIGIDKKTSSRAQRLAKLPEAVFEKVVSGEIPVAKAIAAPKPKAKMTAKEHRTEQFEQAQQNFVSMFASLSRQVIRELAERRDPLSQEECRLAKELADACARAVRRAEAVPIEPLNVETEA